MEESLEAKMSMFKKDNQSVIVTMEPPLEYWENIFKKCIETNVEPEIPQNLPSNVRLVLSELYATLVSR